MRLTKKPAGEGGPEKGLMREELLGLTVTVGALLVSLALFGWMAWRVLEQLP
jgi:hypothetical protein